MRINFTKTNSIKTIVKSARPAFALFFMFVLFSGSLKGQTVTLTTTLDVVDGNTGSIALLNGIPGGAGISLREAIIAANNEPVGATITINIPAGNYTLTLTGAGEQASATGDLDITTTVAAGTKTINLTGAGVATTTITGSGDRIIEIEPVNNAGDITVNISGITFTGGNSTTSAGAILAGRPNDITTISNCVFSNNTAATNGGAISQSSGAAAHDLTITNCTFTNNTATTAVGGAVNYSGLGNVSITGCTFTTNTAGTQGGAINITGNLPGPVTTNILRNAFTGNTANGATFGGAAVAMVNAQAININFNRIVNNNAAGVANGKMITTGGGTVTAMNTDNNWWSVNTGPAAADILGTAAANWLQLKATASPSSIATGGTSTVTASFLTNSANNAIAPADLATVIGLSVSFVNPVLGTLSAAQPTIQASGTATVTFTAGGTGGAGSVNAVVDNVPNSETTPARANITILAPPSITVTGTPLAAFTSCLGSASAEQSFNASGSDLTANIIITAPTGFEVSTTSGSGFGASVALTQVAGSVPSTPIFVRMAASATGTPSGNITVVSTGATTVNVAVSGTVSNPPTTSNAGPDQSFCGTGSPATLAANTPTSGTGTWSVVSGPSTSSAQFSSTTNPAASFTPAGGTGVYTLRWTIATTAPCPDSQDDVVITFSEAVTADAGPDLTVCTSPGSRTLSAVAPSVGTGSWSFVSGPAAAIIFPPPSNPNAGVLGMTVPGNYEFEWIVTNGACVARDTMIVVANPSPPVPTITGGGVTVCQGTTVTLSGPVDPNYTYLWERALGSNGAPFSIVGTGQTLNTTVSGVFRLTVTNQFGCSAASALSIVHVGDYVFNGSIGAGDAQQTGRINRFGVVSTCAVPKTCPGIFSPTGARFYDSYTITNPHNIPVCATIGINTTCSTNVLMVAYLGSFNPNNTCINYLGDPGSSFALGGFMEVTIPANGTIVVVVHEVSTGQGCGSYTLTVDLPRDLSPIIAAPPSVICGGTSTLTAPVADSYLWSPGGATTQSIVTPAIFTPTTFYATMGYGNNGCTRLDSVLVGVTSLPPTISCPANISLNNTAGQCGRTVTYTTTSGGTPTPTLSYTFTGATTGSGTGDGSGSFFNVGTTTVTVTATNICGSNSCSFTVTITDNEPPTLTCPGPVTVCGPAAVPAPDINLVTGVTDNCPGTITVTHQGDVVNGFSLVVPYTITRTYRATDVNGNFAECTQTITVNPIPNAVATPSSQTVCSNTPSAGVNIVLSGNVSGTVFNWTRDNTGTVTGIPASGSGNINGILTNITNAPVTVTFTITPVANGCTGPSVTATVIVNPTPNAVATPSLQTVCSGNAITTVILSGNVSGTTFNWTRDNTGAVTGIPASGSGNISGTLTNTTNAPVTVTFTVVPVANGCSGTAIPVTIIVNPTPNAVATPPAQTICSGSTITTIALSGNVSGTTFNWTRNNTGTVTGIAASGSGDISGALTNTTNAPVTVTFTITPVANGCTGTAITATVIVNPVPSVNAVTNQTVCNGAPVTAVNFAGPVAGTVFNWTNNNTSIGLAANGTGNIASFNAVNTGNSPVTAIIIVTPTFTNAGVTCTGTPFTFTITVNPTPNVNTVANKAACTGSTVSATNFSGAVAGTVFSWTRTPAAIGLGPTSGTGNIPSFTGTNSGSTPLVSTFTVTPSYTNNGVTCTGTPVQFTITINPLPVVTLALPFDTLNRNMPLQTLSGGSPAGGVFSGFGVSGTQIAPSAFGLGNYTVTYSYTDANGCTSSATDVFTIIPAAANINVYPNPADNGVLKIAASPQMAGALVKVYNGFGQKVGEWILSGRLTTYQFKWPAGMYVFEFTKGTLQERRQVIIAR